MNNDDILAQALKRRDEAETADQPNRERAQNDLRFLVGDQWPEEELAAREAESRPCITVNSLPQFVRRVTAQIRNMNPAIRVSAADGEASKDTAEIIEGLIRQIEYQSGASNVYEAGAESAAACGIGHWRIRADYCEGATFDQELLIERIPNPFSVLWDPLAKDPTRKDARYCFVLDRMTREDFTATYPGKTAADVSDNATIPGITHWVAGETVTIAEYFWLEDDVYTIGLLPDGSVVRDPKPPMAFIKKREVVGKKVRWAKISGTDVLEGPNDIPGGFIPVVAVTGEEWHLGEEMYRSSVIRFAKDPQLLYNYARSAQAEMQALQPKAPYMVTSRQIAGLEEIWADANVANRPYLPYNPDQAAPPPQRVPPPIPSSALLSEITLAAEDMKRTTGIYDASLGAQSNETSGVAIRQRQMEAEAGTSVYADNMVKGVSHTGRILVAMIPQVYDTQRIVRILGEDDQEKLVLINALMMTQDGPQPVNDVTVGKYDVRIGVGPSYQSKREESSEGMMEFMRVAPQAAPIIADLVAGMQDWPDADRVAKRLRKTLPPGLVETDEDDEPSPEDQQAMAMQQQAMQAQQQQQEAAMQLDMRKQAAEAAEAEADAQKAQAEAQKAQLEIRRMMLEQQIMAQKAEAETAAVVGQAQLADAQARFFNARSV